MFAFSEGHRNSLHLSFSFFNFPTRLKNINTYVKSLIGKDKRQTRLCIRNEKNRADIEIFLSSA